MKYLHREVSKEVPLSVSILLVLNFRDLRKKEGERTVKETELVTLDDVVKICDEIREERIGRAVQCGQDLSNKKEMEIDEENIDIDAFAFEISLSNCFGLLQLYRVRILLSIYD
jgi:hypothetical protein